MVAYLITFIALSPSRLQSHLAAEQQRDSSWRERGVSSIELAVIVTAMLAAAIAVAALVTRAVTNHSSTIQ